MRKHSCVIAMVLLGLGCFSFWYFQSGGSVPLGIFDGGQPAIDIGDVSLRIEVANTEEERITGLSGRTVLSRKADGLLFVFEKSNYYGIWMKDMKFPIDIIWIDETYEVVDIDENVLPESFPTVYKPTKPVLYVLETNAHYVKSQGIAVRDKVVLRSGYLED
jgi:uncharacterized membrane protein (UPF0127 family)